MTKDLELESIRSKSAADAYDIRKIEINTLLTMVGDKVEELQAKHAEAGAIHWGHVGDLNSIAETLLALLNRRYF